MAQFAPLIAELRAVQIAMSRIDDECTGYLGGIPDDQQASARNLLHYLALRRHDLRHAQPLLAWPASLVRTIPPIFPSSNHTATDAAMSERAECVMLNKGPFICDAVRTLDDILRRMQAHQTKKRPMLRPLQVAHSVLRDLSAANESVPSS